MADPILTASEVRTRISSGATPLASSEFNDTWVDAKVADFEDLVRSYCGEEATEATCTEKIRNVRTGVALLTWPVVLSVTSVTVNGTVLDPDTYYAEHSILRMEAGVFTSSPTVVYQHGLGGPEALKAACSIFIEKLASAERSAQSLDTREIRAQGDGTTYFLHPDWAAKRPTGWSQVDVALNRYDKRIPGIA